MTAAERSLRQAAAEAEEVVIALRRALAFADAGVMQAEAARRAKQYALWTLSSLDDYDRARATAATRTTATEVRDG